MSIHCMHICYYINDKYVSQVNTCVIVWITIFYKVKSYNNSLWSVNKIFYEARWDENIFINSMLFDRDKIHFILGFFAIFYLFQ